MMPVGKKNPILNTGQRQHCNTVHVMLSPTNTAGGARYYHSLLVGFVSFFVCLLFLGSNIFHWLLKKKNLSLLNSWNNRSSELKTCDRYSPQLTVLSLLFKDWKKKKKRGWWSLFFVHQSEDRGENDRWVFCFLIFATSDANRLEVPVSMRNKVIKVPDKKKKKTAQSLSWDFGLRRWRCKLMFGSQNYTDH